MTEITLPDWESAVGVPVRELAAAARLARDEAEARKTERKNLIRPRLRELYDVRQTTVKDRCGRAYSLLERKAGGGVTTVLNREKFAREHPDLVRRAYVRGNRFVYRDPDIRPVTHHLLRQDYAELRPTELVEATLEIAELVAAANRRFLDAKTELETALRGVWDGEETVFGCGRRLGLYRTTFSSAAAIDLLDDPSPYVTTRPRQPSLYVEIVPVRCDEGAE